MGELTIEQILQPLEPVSVEQTDKINHHIYCHHCRHMSTAKLLGRDAYGRVIFRCACASLVTIEPA